MQSGPICRRIYDYSLRPVLFMHIWPGVCHHVASENFHALTLGVNFRGVSISVPTENRNIGGIESRVRVPAHLIWKYPRSLPNLNWIGDFSSLR